MDTAKKIESYTIDDIYALPDGERAELFYPWKRQQSAGGG